MSIRIALPLLVLFGLCTLPGCSPEGPTCVPDVVTRAGGVTLTGTIQSVTAPSTFVVRGTIASGCAASNFQVDTNANTVFVHSNQSAATFADLQVNGNVVVDGTGVTPAEILATRVTLNP